MLNMEECNNNNYVPSYYPAGARPVTSSSTSTLSQGFSSSPGMTRHQATFTFTSPTQCYTLATPRPSIQSTSHISLSAPGVGTSWQHSIPTTMPWVPGATQLPTVGLGNARQFSGYPNHTPVKRPKRKAFDEPNEAPCPKVYLCLDKFKNLHITQPHSQPLTKSQPDPSSHAIVGGRGKQAESWQHYNDLEQRLDEELEEDSDRDPSGHQSGVIKVADGMLEVPTSQAFLPRGVMQGVQAPCMQVVLWQAPLGPGASIRDMLGPPRQATSSTQASTTTSPSIHHRNPVSSTDPLSDCVLPGGMCCWEAGATHNIPSGAAHNTSHNTPSPHVQHSVFSNNNNDGFSMFNNNNVFNNNNSSIRFPQDVFSLDEDQDMQL